MSKLFIKDRFATTPNNLLSNPDITLRAKGLFAFIQGKPDKWSFSAERIAFENKEGVQSVRSALQELEKFGYLRRLKTKNEKGHWEIDYILHSEPENPADEIPTLGIRPTETHITEKPTSGNPTLENYTNNSNTDIRKKDINNTINTINISFDEFWDLYDKKVSRDNSEKRWNKLSDKDRELIMQFIPKYKAYQPDKNFRKDPLTFFNNKTWLDEIPNKNGSSVIPENETAEEKDLRIRIESFKKIKVH